MKQTASLPIIVLYFFFIAIFLDNEGLIKSVEGIKADATKDVRRGIQVNGLVAAEERRSKTPSFAKIADKKATTKQANKENGLKVVNGARTAVKDKRGTQQLKGHAVIAAVEKRKTSATSIVGKINNNKGNHKKNKNSDKHKPRKGKLSNMHPEISEVNKAKKFRGHSIKKSDLKGSPLDILCQVINFINKLLNTKFLSDICKTSNQTTTLKSSSSQPSVSTTIAATSYSSESKPASTTKSTTTTEPLPASTTKKDVPTTTTPPSSVISFFGLDWDNVYLSCDHVPGIINIITALYGSNDSSLCPPTSVEKTLKQLADGKTTAVIAVVDYYFGELCSNTTNIPDDSIQGSNRLEGTYTCTPISLDTSMVQFATELTAVFISCPAAVISVESATFGSIDGTTCPPTSVLDFAAIQAANGKTSFSLWVNSSMTMHSLCLSTSENYFNALSITYRCQNTSALVFSGATLDAGNIGMICPYGQIKVIKAFKQALGNNTCSTDYTAAVQSLVPDRTRNMFLNHFHFLNFDYKTDGQITETNCKGEENLILFTSQYTCDNKASPMNLVAQVYTQLVLECPIGKKINLESSDFYCSKNTSVSFLDLFGPFDRCDGFVEICSFWVQDFVLFDDYFDDSLDFMALPDPNCTAADFLLSMTYTCEP